MRKIIVIICILCNSLAMIISCRKENERLVNPIEIKASIACKEMAAPIVSGFGTIVYKSKADVYPTSTSNVKSLLVDKGMQVKEGDVLALLDDVKLTVQLRQAEADVQSKKAMVSLAKAQFEEGCQNARKTLLAINRVEFASEQKQKEYDNLVRIYNNKLKLHTIGGISDEELKNVRMNMESAENALNQVRLELETARIGFSDADIWAAGFDVPSDAAAREALLVQINTATLKAQLEASEADLKAALSQMETIKIYIAETIIKSPISGIVAERYVDIGEKADPDTRLFTLFATESVYVSVTMNVQRCNNISVGFPAEVRVGDELYKGKVEQISPYADNKTGGRMIKIAIDNIDRSLIPGLFADVNIIAGGVQPRLSVPKDAVMHRQDDYSDASVFLIRDGGSFRKKITVDFVKGDRVFIKEGLSVGDVVAVSRLDHLSDGCQVVIK